MSGYIILNGEGKRLTHGKVWMNDDVWVWSEEEKDQILVESRRWEIKPASIQHAYFNRHNGSVVVIGSPILVEVV
jgi:hypothetical protein